MRQPVQYSIHTNFLTSEECDELLNSIPQPTAFDETPAINREESQPPLDLWYRLEYLPMRVEVNITDQIRKKLEKITGRPFVVIDDRMYIIKYEEGDEAVPHRDPCHDTFIVQLNDNFSGGTLCLDRHTVDLNKGDCVLFTNSTCKHKVKPIQSGTRLSLAMWINYPHSQLI